MKINFWALCGGEKTAPCTQLPGIFCAGIGPIDIVSNLIMRATVLSFTLGRIFNIGPILDDRLKEKIQKL